MDSWIYTNHCAKHMECNVVLVIFSHKFGLDRIEPTPVISYTRPMYTKWIRAKHREYLRILQWLTDDVFTMLRVVLTVCLGACSEAALPLPGCAASGLGPAPGITTTSSCFVTNDCGSPWPLPVDAPLPLTGLVWKSSLDAKPRPLGALAVPLLAVIGEIFAPLPVGAFEAVFGDVSLISTCLVTGFLGDDTGGTVVEVFTCRKVLWTPLPTGLGTPVPPAPCPCSRRAALPLPGPTGPSGLGPPGIPLPGPTGAPPRIPRPRPGGTWAPLPCGKWFCRCGGDTCVGPGGPSNCCGGPCAGNLQFAN